MPVIPFPIDRFHGVSPVIISQSDRHILIAIEVSRAELARHRRFLENLLSAAQAVETAD